MTTKTSTSTEIAPVQMIKTQRAKFAAVLPDHIDADQFIGLATGALYRDQKLIEAANNLPGAFANALMRCAQLGHQPGTEEFYLVPRKIKGQMQVQGIEGYRGILERMYRSGAVASVIVREVCENDTFEFIEGEHDRPQHRIDWFGGTRGDMIGVYAYAILSTGAVSRVVILSKDDVMKAKESSDGATSEYSPWKKHERAMWWKTAARRLEPWVPTSAEYRREQLRAAAEAARTTTTTAEQAPVGVDTETGEIHDIEIVPDDPTAEEPSEAK